jgi:AraC-like DNA-binding protein
MPIMSVKPVKRAASIAARFKARKIKQQLDLSPDQIPTLASLEAEYSLGKAHLQSGFREQFGKTIGAYAKELKLNYIKEQLKDYSQTLDTIAIQTGYNGGEALCRFFKKMEGVTPGRWRRDYLNSL